MKRLFSALLFALLLLPGLAPAQAIGDADLLSAVTATGAGSGLQLTGVIRSFHAKGSTSAGAGAATIKVQGSIDNTTWVDLGTITLTLATTATADGFVSQAPWKYVRGNVTALSGTGAAVTLYAGHK